MNHQLIEDLKATRDLIAKHGRCTYGMSDAQGRGCLVVCVYEGVRANDGHADLNRVHAVLEAIGLHIPRERSRTGQEGDLIGFNEHPDTTDHDVLMVFDKAIAEAGGMAL